MLPGSTRSCSTDCSATTNPSRSPSPPDPDQPDPHEPDSDSAHHDEEPPEASAPSETPQGQSGAASDSSSPDSRPDAPDAANAAEPTPQADPAPDPVAGEPPLGRVDSAGDAYRTRLFTAAGIGRGEAGKRSRAITSSGRTVGAAPARGERGTLHLPATIRTAAPHQVARGRDTGRLKLAGTDLQLAVTEGRESNLVLLVVDASGSMAAQKRMSAVKAAAMSLLLDAYQRRDKVGLITFRGGGATLALPPTSSIDIAARRLRDLPSGGRTPLAEGLICAAETLRLEAIRDPRRRPLLVVVTDGRATHGPGAVERSQVIAAQLRHSGIASVVLDCETGRFTLGLAARLSEHLGAEYVPVGEVGADQLVGTLRQIQGARKAAA